MIDSLQEALDKQDSLGVSIIITRLRNLGFTVNIVHDSVLVTK